MKTALVLVAAGRSARFRGDIPKQYRALQGKPVILHIIKSLKLTELFDPFVIVVAEGDEHIHEVIPDMRPSPLIVTGGATRTASVKAGLAVLQDNPPNHVLIHDAARPLVSATIISDVMKALETYQAVAPALPVVDAIKSVVGNKVFDMDRDQIRRIQTPQGFHYTRIWDAFKQLSDAESFVDDIAVAQAAGLSIGLVDGEENNLKITYASDLKKAEQIIQQTRYIATGQGFDVHRIEQGETIWLCGVEIVAGFSLKGHSDADVGLHALTDAILGALADGDIGDHFPPSDPQWKGAASDRFLQFAADKVTARGGYIQHVDITLIFEKPKIKLYRGTMRERIAGILNLPMPRVSVKATTTEKLGFTGRGEGLAAQATATLELPA
ncbi:MAG: bifunctional 2-C-methyl-D-erythritol 4-phosphate cytidylyltransferase/2-C-methyl-D-erythritol 2,4-cyclodiphosphate synthase [Hyphomonadaceae bacterium]|nr:bifunctional 2-C-methyl-D-erythritol 4-phosphate cytidylyltransferase/2-C-methyl-D-erythritol 2,4-cyclodiphosphate synthase [Hyphomonadaceae bacterium]